MHRVLAYGSCVSRDTIQSDEELTLVRYVARQSMISATTGGVRMPDAPNKLTSKFQIGMLESDFRSTGMELLRDAAPYSDVVLIDLIDERLGVLELADGTFLTRSAELVRSGLIPYLPRHRLVPFGTDEHFAIWAQAAHQVIQQLKAWDRLSRTLAIGSRFAAFDEHGDPAPRFRGIEPDEWNAQYERYFGLLSALGTRVHRLPDDVRTTKNHRWGPDPYHYTADVYRGISSELRRLTGSP